MAKFCEVSEEIELESSDEKSSNESIIYLSQSSEEIDASLLSNSASSGGAVSTLTSDHDHAPIIPALAGDESDDNQVFLETIEHSSDSERETYHQMNDIAMPQDSKPSENIPFSIPEFPTLNSNGQGQNDMEKFLNASGSSIFSTDSTDTFGLKPKKRRSRHRRRPKSSQSSEGTTDGLLSPRNDQSSTTSSVTSKASLDCSQKPSNYMRKNKSTSAARDFTRHNQRSRHPKEQKSSGCMLAELSPNADQPFHRHKPRGLMKEQYQSPTTSQSEKPSKNYTRKSSTGRKVQSKRVSERKAKREIKENLSNSNEGSLQGIRSSDSPVGNDSRENVDPALMLSDLDDKIKRMKSSCLSKYESDLFEYENELSKYTEKKNKKRGYTFRKIEHAEHNKFMKENLEKLIAECGLVKEAFVEFCAKLEQDIEELQSASPSIIIGSCQTLQKRFDRECFKYDNPLPMYSRRKEILTAVENNSTCVVIGETGSGKSTQLVQYLYEAGYAEQGIIACTQPRKLAARSLAEHVSKEVGERKGTTYAYYGNDSKFHAKAKVVFMTDHMLLNECIADRRLSKYSVVVIDEAHERSIHTDILIALIKRCLPDRPDLRVIVTSATINPTLFSEYFGGPYDCPIIEVPGRVYPVKVFYQSPSLVPVLDRKYVEESVEKAYDIHLKNKAYPGDILVFLTSPVEIEQACKLAQSYMKGEVLVLPLHGKLEPEEQQKVFAVSPKKRKVVFSTNVAETSVTIPGIKYVIDTGLSKEMRYDAQRNMNSLEVRPVSKSSANQRKGRAGRTGPGECHRLFSEMEYSSMREDSTPEILRISLAFAVIKLYEFGIDDVHSFEFVDAPDRKALDDAVKNLKFHGAIVDGKLMSLGKQMALLPLEPNLSKLFLDAISSGIGAAGAASVAISSLAGQVFFRPVDELREQSDQMRLPFCQDSGDQMTNLHAYYEWSKQTKKDRNIWCKEKFVNGKSMRMVKELVDELTVILKQKCHIKIAPVLESLDGVDDILPKLIFNAFMNNLSVHLGHSKVGYWNENYPNEQLVLHYGSSMNYLGAYPPCVVFEKTQKTTQNFMLQVLPVKEEWITSAVDSKKLPYHPTEAPLYSTYRVSKLVISNLGPIIISKLRRKYNPDRRIAVREFMDYDIQPIFEYSKEKGELTIISQQFYHDQIQTSVMTFVEDIRQTFRKETFEHGIVGENDDVRIIIAEGGIIQQVLMTDEFRGIKVLNLPYIEKDGACEELQEYGECTTECSHVANDQTVTLIVKYQNPSEARLALQHKFEKFEDPRVVIHRLQHKNRNSFTLKLSWPRRERRDYAYINLDEEEYECARDYLPPGCMSFRDGISSLNFQFHKGNAIRVQGLQSHMDAEYVRSRLRMHCPEIAENWDIRFLYEEAFPETRETYLKVKLRLNDALSKMVQRKNYFVDLQFPRNKSTFYNANVYFDNSDDCEQAKESFGKEFNAQMLLSFSWRYSPQIFSVIKPSIEKISAGFPGLISYDRKDHWGNVFVKITAGDIGSFIDARDTINAAVEPLQVCFDEKEAKYASTVIFMKVVRKIETETRTRIKWQSFNVCNNTLCIYGTEKNKIAAQLKVKEHLSKNLSDVSFFEIDLKNYTPGILRHLVITYGPDVCKITEKFDGVRATKIDTRKHVLLLFSVEPSYKAIVESLKEFCAASPDLIQTSDDTDEIVECCVCYESHDFSMTFYRLECCGHVYCKECIIGQLDPQTIKFPVVCAAENCEQKFVWTDFDSLIKNKAIRLQDLKSAALKHFVSMNSSIYHHCSSPDCDMIYAITEEGERFVCNQCGANICTHCHGKWHDGYDTCAAYQNRHKKDTVVEDWMRKNRKDRKMCPNCKVPIEKNGGCRKVLCKCGVNICWICLRFYETAEQCYDHLTEKHNGIFDEHFM